MCSKDLGADVVLAWPQAQIAVMGAEGAANIIFRKDIEAAEDKEAMRAQMIDEYRNALRSPIAQQPAVSLTGSFFRKRPGRHFIRLL